MKNPYEYLTPAECASHLQRTIEEVRLKLTDTAKHIAEVKERQRVAQTPTSKALAEAMMKGAEENYNIARKEYREDISERLDKIKSGMLNRIRQKSLADPSEVDLAAVELLKSGVLNAADLKNLAEKYAANDNRTMLRIIAQEAQKRFDAAPGRGLTHNGNPAERVAYLDILERASGMDGQKYIDAFDGLSHIIKNTFTYDTEYFDKHKENIEHFMAVLTDQE